MFPSKKALDKTFNDFNNKASSLIKFQSSPKKNVTSPKKEKYKTLKESAKPMYSKARLTMDTNGFRDYQSKVHQTSRKHRSHTRQRQNSIGESDRSSKNSRSSSFENEENDDDNTLDDQIKNNVPVPISLECKYNKPSIIKQESIELSIKNKHTPKLNEDYFLVRTYQRGGSCLVRVDFTEEEKEILKRQKEENESLERQREEMENLKRQIEEDEIMKKQNDNQIKSINSTDSFQETTDQTQKSNKVTRTDSILSETDSMKDFTDFCHSRIEMENSNKNLTNNAIDKHQGICPSDSFEDNLDLIHIMDESGKIVWNSVAEKYDVGPFIWYDNSVLDHTNNQENSSDNILENPSVTNIQQCNIDIQLTDDNFDDYDVCHPENILDDNTAVYLDDSPSGYRHEVQSPDPRNYNDISITDKNLNHNSEFLNNVLV